MNFHLESILQDRERPIFILNPYLFLLIYSNNQIAIITVWLGLLRKMHLKSMLKKIACMTMYAFQGVMSTDLRETWTEDTLDCRALFVGLPQSTLGWQFLNWALYSKPSVLADKLFSLPNPQVIDKNVFLSPWNQNLRTMFPAVLVWVLLYWIKSDLNRELHWKKQYLLGKLFLQQSWV